jgi:hypothetical protein
MKNAHMNHLVRSDPETKGKVEINSRSNGRYDILVFKGDTNKATKIEDVGKDKLIEMIKSNL